MTRRWPLAALMAVLLAGGPAPVRAQDDPTDDATPESPEPVRLELIDQQMAFERDQPIRLTYRVTGDLEAATIVPAEPEQDEPPRRGGEREGSGEDTEPPPDEEAAAPPTLAVQITSYADIDEVDRLDGLIGPDVDRLAFGFATDGVEIVDARDLIEIRSDGTGVLELEIPTDSGVSDADHLGFDEPGLHALRVELVRGEFPDESVVSTAGTVVQRLGPVSGKNPLDLAIMGAVSEPPVDADEEELRSSAADVLAMTEVASGVESASTWSFPPRVVEQLADDIRVDDLDEALGGDELVSRPLLPIDVSSTAGVDRMESFTRQLRAGEEVLTDAIPTAPTRRDVWIAREPLSGRAAQELRDLGVRYVAMTGPLYTASFGTLAPTTERFIDIELPEGGRLSLLVLDPIGVRFAAGVGPALGPTEYAVRHVAGLLLESVLNRRPARRSRILSGADFGPLDASLVSELEAVAATTPDVRFTIGSALTGLTGTARNADGLITVSLPETAGPDLAARVAVIDDARRQLFDAVAMLPDDDPRLAEWDERVETLLSTGYDDDVVRDRVGEILDESRQVTGAVVAPEPFTFTLTGKTGDIELVIGNRSPDVLTVVVELSSPKLIFPDGETTVELQADTETKVLVPVEARANGTSAVTVEVRSPTGTALVEPVRLTSRVTTLTGLGQVLTGAFVLVLLTWWFTHWRARRRTALAEGADRHPAGAGPGGER